MKDMEYNFEHDIINDMALQIYHWRCDWLWTKANGHSQRPNGRGQRPNNHHQKKVHGYLIFGHSHSIFDYGSLAIDYGFLIFDHDHLILALAIWPFSVANHMAIGNSARPYHWLCHV